MLQNNYNSDLNKQTVHLALSPWDLTDDYNRHACVTLLSFLDHCSEQAVVHLLYDQKLTIGKEKETEYTKECYQKIADRFGAKIVYHHVELPEWVCNIPSMKIWTPGAIMRLYLPDLLPLDVEKILYLDCDMVVLTEIDSLWNRDISRYILAACRDDWASERLKHKNNYLKNHQILPECYFNSGLLLLNLKKMRADSFVSQAISYLQQNPDLKYPDQDILNWYCKGKYLSLDKKYNVFSWNNDALSYVDDCIIHYTIGKPWKAYYGMIDDFYWNYLIQTPWAETESDRIKYIRAAPDLNKAIDLVSKRLLSITYGTKVDKIKNQFRIILSMLLSIIYEMKKIIGSK